MNDTRNADLPGGDEATAAEYALGLLSEAEKQAFEAQLASDPDLRQDVAAWAEYLATLTDNIPEVAPPASVLRKIEADAFGAPPAPIWRQVIPYLIGAVAGAAMAWAVFVTGLTSPTGPELRADLAPTSGDIAMTARFDPASGVLAVDQIAGAQPEGRVLELWLIADAGAAPISLGLLSASGGTVLTLPALLAERLPGATLAVSDEPIGGSPTGAPTGTVQATGILAIS